MKKSISTTQQSNIWFRKETDQHHIVCLRRNHEKFEVENTEGKIDTYWKCDETEIQIPLRNDIEQYVETNFEALFNAGILLEVT